MDIVRIVIKGSSGYGPYYEAHKDEVVITPVSITYEFFPAVEDEIHHHRKWSYKTDSPEFRVLFKQIAGMAPAVLHGDIKMVATDIGATDITVTYEDKHSETETFFCPGDFYADWFQYIKQMIPPCEDIPAVLQTGAVLL